MAQQHQFKQVSGTLSVLGTVVGTDFTGKMAWAKDKVMSWQPIFDILASEYIPSQVSLLITRWMGTAKPNFLARSLPPRASRIALELLDRATQKCVETRLDLTFERFSDFMLHLPLSQGGAGFTRTVDFASTAFIASVASTLRHCANTPLNNSLLKTLPTFNKALRDLACTAERERRPSRRYTADRRCIHLKVRPSSRNHTWSPKEAQRQSVQRNSGQTTYHIHQRRKISPRITADAPGSRCLQGTPVHFGICPHKRGDAFHGRTCDCL